MAFFCDSIMLKSIYFSVHVLKRFFVLFLKKRHSVLLSSLKNHAKGTVKTEAFSQQMLFIILSALKAEGPFPYRLSVMYYSKCIHSYPSYLKPRRPSTPMATTSPV
jgi:hypothetical protein